MQIKSIGSIGGFTLFSIVSIVRGINLPAQQQNMFILIWLFILFPIAGLISAIPLGHAQVGLWRAGAYALYTALFSQFTYWIAFQSLDGESFLMTCALTIIGLGIGDLIYEHQQQHKQKQKCISSQHTSKK